MLGRPHARGATHFVTPASTPIPGVIEIGSRRQTFLDDLLLHEASQISKFVGRPEKYSGNPIMVADQPWEQGRSAVFSGVQITGQSVLFDDEEGIFKMWYLGWPWQEGKGHLNRRPWCYAISRDGYNWEKPNLGIYDYQGSTRNNIVLDWSDPQYFNVIKDPGEKDPLRRYKALGEMEGPIPNHTGGVAVAFSPDGLHWKNYEGNPVVRHGPNLADAPTIFGWDPKRRKYVSYFRPGHPIAGEFYAEGLNRGAHMRTYGYSESDDFIHWTPTRLMLAPDDKDRTDFQYMQLTAGIDGEFYVGFHTMYETHEQTWDTFLLSSRDGFHWNWIDRNVPFLGRGEVGTYDDGYMTPNGPIFRDGKVWIYYSSFSGAHSMVPTKLGKTDIAIALCTMPQNRWMGLLAGPNRGTIVTRPLFFSGSRLLVDIDASVPIQMPRPDGPRRFDECAVRIAVEEESGAPIERFTAERSAVLTSSGEQEVKWSGGADLGKWAGKPVRLRFEMLNAALYSFQFV